MDQQRAPAVHWTGHSSAPEDAGAARAALPPEGSGAGGSPATTARARGVRHLKVRKGKDVVIRGSRYDCVYVNHDGWLARYKILHNGSRQIIDFILPGQVFGLPACLFQRALYSVVTITEANLSTIPFNTVDSAFERDPALAKALCWSAAYEAAILAEHLVDAGRRSAYERVGNLLLELFVRLNSGHRGGEARFSIPLTQELIADALGLTTVHVNRTLRNLREDKLIATDRRSVTIIDFEALSALSDFERAYLEDVAAALRGPARLCRVDDRASAAKPAR